MAESNSAPATCAFCSGKVDRENGPRCGKCGAYHHRDCWLEFEGCTTFGCENSPDMIKFQSEQKD